MEELCFRSAVEQVAAILGDRISSRELLDLYLERVERINPDINAVVALDVEGARKRALAADEALAAGEKTGPLHGLPVTIKDTFEVAGMPCASGAPILADHRPVRDADAVQALVDAGAIVFGKTNVPIFGGDFQSYNNVYGQSNNPWNPERTPGGSSGGAAAALAAGLSALELGSDIGGSIRTPAHFCGVCGHKSSYGIVPMRGHVPPPPGVFSGHHTLSMDIVVAGPLARSVEDIELSMKLLAAPERYQRTAWKLCLPPPRHVKLGDFRIGLLLNSPICPLDSGYGDVLQGAVDTLAKAGAGIRERHPAIDIAGSHDIFLSLLAAVMGAGTPPGTFGKWQETAASLPPEDNGYLARHLRGATQTHRDWVAMDGMRQLLRQQWADFFTDFDILLCPVAPVPAIPHDHSYMYDRTILVNGEECPYMDILSWAGLAGVAGLPATVIPAGRTPEGLPVGMQIIGPWLEDYTPIQAARLFEQVLEGFTPPPGI